MSMISPGRHRADQLPADSDPWVIAKDPTLDGMTKVRRLRELEYDVRQGQVATEEGMPGRSPLPSLDDVLAALAQVGSNSEPARTPTKT